MTNGRSLQIGDQAAELCLQIRHAVEGWLLYDALGTYVVVRNNLKRAKPFECAYYAIWQAAFTSMIVSSHNLMDTKRSHFSLFPFADALESAGEGTELVGEIRALRTIHEDLAKSLVRVRHTTFAHVDIAMSSKDQFNEAELQTAGLRNFINSLIRLFDSVSSFSSFRVVPPDPRVAYQMMEMLHLAVRAREM